MFNFADSLRHIFLEKIVLLFSASCLDTDDIKLQPHCGCYITERVHRYGSAMTDEDRCYEDKCTEVALCCGWSYIHSSQHPFGIQIFGSVVIEIRHVPQYV